MILLSGDVFHRDFIASIKIAPKTILCQNFNWVYWYEWVTLTLNG